LEPIIKAMSRSVAKAVAERRVGAADVAGVADIGTA
jgi:hypothetical protein